MSSLLKRLLNRCRRSRPVRESFKQVEVGATIFVKDYNNPDDLKIRVGIVRKVASETSLLVYFPSLDITDVVTYDGVNWNRGGVN